MRFVVSNGMRFVVSKSMRFTDVPRTSDGPT